jgi:mRNA interferase RelE/StbE
VEVTYEIEYLESVVRRDIPALPKATKERIRREIERKLTTRPIEFGKPLRYSLKGCRRIRVGDYRIVYVVKGARVTVVKIGHRKEVYE